MAIFTSPTSFHSASSLLERRYLHADATSQLVADSTIHSSHPSFSHLVLLVFEAVLEVVCVSLPGYIAARQGLFDADAQKLVANLNVTLFTPCLVFTKLASQLTAEKFTDLAIIPAIFVVMTAVSYLCSAVVSRLFRLKKRQSNFVTAMAVFGNSNSLPISLVISLSQTLSGLHWDRVPNDNDDEVAARGILYLLIFQQLGQLVRWTWGYHVLLAPKERYVEEGDIRSVEHGQEHYMDNPEQTDPDEPLVRTRSVDQEQDLVHATSNSVSFESGTQTPVTDRNLSYIKLANHGTEQSPPRRDMFVDSDDEDDISDEDRSLPVIRPPPNGPFLPRQSSTGDILTFPDVEVRRSSTPAPSGVKGLLYRWNRSASKSYARVVKYISNKRNQIFVSLPPSVQKFLTVCTCWIGRFLRGAWNFMNPPLWAMLVAIIVASIPDLQRLFFDEGTFVRNSITRAIDQNGQVAVPLILVVLGANLARNTLPKESIEGETQDPKEERNLIIASLVARMLLPMLVMAPFLALLAKYAPISILADPIFIIVCFLLTGAPSALQLAQICQINNVFMGAMSRLLFQSYVVWILPSTLVLVMTALEVVEWATTGK